MYFTLPGLDMTMDRLTRRVLKPQVQVIPTSRDTPFNGSNTHSIHRSNRTRVIGFLVGTIKLVLRVITCTIIDKKSGKKRQYLLAKVAKLEVLGKEIQKQITKQNKK